MAHSCDPNYQPGQAPSDQEHDASASAAIVAANLLSSARLVLNLDSVFTEYSAQYMVENACPNKVDGQGETDHRCNNLTVKDCLRFALKDGIPRADQWVHLGCMIKPPPSAYTPPLVSMKGELIETMNDNEAFKLLRQQQPVGAKLHVFSPGIDLVGDDGIYLGPGDPSGNAHYVGLRDVIICGREKAGEETVAVVKICYKKKLSFIKVSLNVMFMQIANDSGFAADNEAIAKPGRLLVDFCVPRLTTE